MSTSKLTQKQKNFIRAWERKLRTGGMRQTTGALCLITDGKNRHHAYCCLGVACSVAHREFGDKRFKLNRREGFGYRLVVGESYDGLPPGTLKEYLPDEDEDKYHSVNPTLRIPKSLQHKTYDPDDEYSSPRTEAEATELNDAYDFTFKEIAACIRETWPTLFRGKYAVAA